MLARRTNASSFVQSPAASYIAGTSDPSELSISGVLYWAPSNMMTPRCATDFWREKVHAMPTRCKMFAYSCPIRSRNNVQKISVLQQDAWRAKMLSTRVLRNAIGRVLPGLVPSIFISAGMLHT